MKQYYYLLFFPILLLLILGCSEDSAKVSELEVTPTILNFTSEGGMASFEIKCDVKWTITTDNSVVAVSPSNGYGNQKVNVFLPASNSINQQKYTIIVKPEAGTPANVTVNQEGQFISGDVSLQVSNYEGVISFGGNSQDSDSLRVLSNVPWQLYGPDWLEAWNGSRWVTLSTERAMLQGDKTTDKDAEGTAIVRLRTRSACTSEEGRMESLVLKPAYTGLNKEYSLTAVQLGLHMVVPNFVVTLANGIACDWECGSSVAKLGAAVTDHVLSDAENPNWEYMEPDYLYFEENLTENTTYYINAFGFDKNNNYGYTTTVVVATGSSQNQALAEIVNPTFDFDKKQWSWRTKMNSYCKGYRMWASIESSSFDYPDVILAWFFGQISYDEQRLEEFPIYTSDDEFTWKLDAANHIQIITWGAGQDGNHFASLISRYCSMNDDRYNAPKRNEGNRAAGSVKIDFGKMHKSFKRIK